MNNLTVPDTDLSSFSELSQLLDDAHRSDEAIGIDIKRLFWSVWSRRTKIISVTFIATIVSCLFAIIFLEPIWSGKTTLLKKEQQDEFRVGRYGIPFKIQEYSFRTLLDTLLLPGTLEQTMQRTGVYLPSHKFSKLIDIQISKESKAFTFGVRWNDPVIAAELTNNLADVFLQRNKELRRNEIEHSLLQYRQRLEVTKFKSIAAAGELLSYQSKNDISDIQTQLIVLLEKRQEVEVDVREIEANLLANIEQIIQLEQQISNEPKMIVQSSYFANPMKKNLTSLEWQLAQMTARYTEVNPKVKDILQRIDTLKMIVKQGKDNDSPTETLAHNPVREELTIRMYEKKGESIGFTTQLDKLNSLVDELSARITALIYKRRAYQVLDSKREAANNLQRDLRERVDSLNVLLHGQLGDFELLERATVPVDRQGTRRKLFVLISAGLVFAICVLISMAIEIFEAKIRTLKDLESIHDFGLSTEFCSTNTPTIRLDEPTTRTSMQFRRYSNDLQITLEKSGTNRVAFVSIEGNSGTTTTAANTAISMHLKGESTMLVDADLRPEATSMNIADVCGSPLADADLPGILKGRFFLPESSKDRNRFFLISAGEKENRNGESVLSIGGQAMTTVRNRIEQLKKWTIYILPPVSNQEASFEALKQIGTAILVVRSGRSSARETEHFVKRMERHGINIISAVITDVPEELTDSGSIDLIKTITDDFKNLWTRIVNLTSIQLAYRQV